MSLHKHLEYVTGYLLFIIHHPHRRLFFCHSCIQCGRGMRQGHFVTQRRSAIRRDCPINVKSYETMTLIFLMRPTIRVRRQSGFVCGAQRSETGSARHKLEAATCWAAPSSSELVAEPMETCLETSLTFISFLPFSLGENICLAWGFYPRNAYVIEHVVSELPKQEPGWSCSFLEVTFRGQALC